MSTDNTNITPPEPESQIKALNVEESRSRCSTSVGGFQTFPVLISLFVNNKASEMQISHCWSIRHEWVLPYLLGPMDWLALVRNDLPQEALTA